MVPMLDVIHRLCGRQSVPAHGNLMPVRGRQLEIQAKVDDVGPFGGEATVSSCVLSIAYYPEFIQE
jgi:hypothetical protein